jgi:hypothetical protein
VLLKLKKELFSEDDKYIVNLTCGTKIMLIGILPILSHIRETLIFTINEFRMNSIKKRMKILGIKGLLGAEELKNKKLKI